MMRERSPQQDSRRGCVSPAASAFPAQLSARALLDFCEQIYDSFNSGQHTLDTHLHNSLQELGDRLSADEACFIQEVCGCTLCLRGCVSSKLAAQATQASLPFHMMCGI